MKNKFEINGIVNCPCGGCLISNSGKTIGRYDVKKTKKFTVVCWDCQKEYNADEVFNQRKENKIVVFNENKRIN